MGLESEQATYQTHRIDLLSNEGKYILIEGDEIAGPWEIYDALQAGYDRFGLVPSLIKKIQRVESVQYFSRDLH